MVSVFPAKHVCRPSRQQNRHNPMHWMQLAACLLISGAGGAVARAQQEIGYIERFALAEDRRAALGELIPGTQDFYYYHTLHYQNEGQLTEAQAMIDAWRAKLNDNQSLLDMELRQRILSYSVNPEQTLQFLKTQLGVNLSHHSPTRDRAAALPNQLDNSQLAVDRLLEGALQLDRSFSTVETRFLPLLLTKELAADQLRSLLARLDRSDLEQLVPKLAQELKLRDSQGFGWAPVHQLLSLDQLEQLLKLVPTLIENETFIRTFSARLHPTAGQSLADKQTMREYMLRLRTWVGRLPASQNSYKALVLANLLRLDMSEGRYDRDLFLEYLALPRPVFYYSAHRIKQHQGAMVQMEYSLPEVSLPPIRTDDDLVRRYLEHFLQRDDNLQPYAEFIEREYLERVLAETKILYGLGDAAVWFAKLSPTEQKLLKERIELRFAPENVTQFKSDQATTLQLEVKNVDQVIIKVYEINTLNYYRKNLEAIDTTLDLDGLVANAERKLTFTQPAERRHVEAIEFPELSGRGVWVVDILGGGKRSRALIQRGQLRGIEYLAAAGQIIEVVNESGKRVPTAHVELNGRVFRPNDQGKIILPYAEELATRQALLVDEDFANPLLMAHFPEAYQLQAGFFVDRQSLISGKIAQLLIRPRLLCNEQPVSVALLKDVQLTITATDLDGVETSQTVNKLELSNAEELVHEFLVMQRLSQLKVKLSGKVLNRSQAIEQTLETSYGIPVNGVLSTMQIGDLYLRSSAEGFHLLALGRNGEAIPRTPIQISVKSKVVTTPQYFQLATDDAGRVQLGKLEDVERLTAEASGMQAATFELDAVHRSWPTTVHIGAGGSVELPLGTQSAQPSDFSLFAIRNSLIFSSEAEHLELLDGSLKIQGLAAGDYWLFDRSVGQQVTIAVAAEEANDGFAMGAFRILQMERRQPVIIRSAELSEGDLTIAIDHADAATRVHVFGDPVYPEMHAARRLTSPHWSLYARDHGPTRSYYIDSLQLDEEYRYILERQGLTKYPGNLLPQPSVLINPWEVSVTENFEQFAVPGAPMPSAKDESESAMKRMRAEGEADDGRAFANSRCYDFLTEGAEIAANLEVEDGKVTLALEDLTNYSQVTIVVVHPTSMDSRSVVLPLHELKTRDLRLESAFPEDQHLAQTQRVQLLGADERVTLGDARARRLQTYSTLGSVFQLYATLLNNPEWEKFRFITQWSSLAEAEKQKYYGEFACHELDFFLYYKDRAFFDRVIKPAVAQKLDKQLVDRWLLDEPLVEYTDLWRLQRLNTLERILLAQRSEALTNGTQRWLQEYVAAHPLDPQWRQQRFEATLLGRGLDTGNDKLAEGFAGGLGGMMGGRPGVDPGAMDGSGISDATESLSRGGRRRAQNMPARSDRREAAAAADAFFDAPMAVPEAAVMFRSLDKTREWAESNYYHVRIQSQSSNLIPPNAFWNEYLLGGGKPFLSEHLDLPVSNLHEALCALAVMDLPFEATEPAISVEENQLVVKASSDAVAFLESIEPATIAEDVSELGSKILVGQDVYLAQPDTAELANRPVQGALLAGIPYQTNVVVTNPTNLQIRVRVLMQLPAGSLPLAGTKLTRSRTLDLQPYSTQQLNYQFYFPKPGEFEHYGAQVSSESSFLASVASRQYRVLSEPELVDEQTWSYVADWGTNEQVLQFLAKANLQQIDLSRIAFRMRDVEFFRSTTAVLAASGYFDSQIWGYAFEHNLPEQIEQYLQNRPDVVARVGLVFDSPLLHVIPDEQLSYEHLDYRPLVTARTHRLGPTNKIMNPSLHAQYHKLLTVVAHQSSISHEQFLPLTYYLLLQNRTTEALTWFEKVNAQQLSTPLVVDYFSAYLDFYRGEFGRAAELAGKYVDYPIPRWQSMFRQVAEQHREREMMLSGEGITSEIIDDSQRPQSPEQQRLVGERDMRQSTAAKKSPSLDLALTDGRLTLKHSNVNSVQVNYYLMDIELLFSRNPFVARGNDAVPVIEPNAVATMELAAGATVSEVSIPAEIRNRNVLVETTAEGISRSVVVTANTLTMNMVEPMGWLQVRNASDRSPVVGSYVKVYAQKQDGSVTFFKDGYTDLRGQFDYATLSTSDLDSVSRFAILVLDEQLGASVREVAPPTR